LPCGFPEFILPGYQVTAGGGIVAQRVVLTDDLDGSEAAETITYTINGQDYEIDLSEGNAQRFHDAFNTYIEKCRRVERQTPPTRRSRGNGRRRGGGSGRDDIPQIREWAEANGYEVSARGRIKKEVIDAYDEAHR
jgi:hypothetical protein